MAVDIALAAVGLNDALKSITAMGKANRSRTPAGSIGRILTARRGALATGLIMRGH